MGVLAAMREGVAGVYRARDPEPKVWGLEHLVMRQSGQHDGVTGKILYRKPGVRGGLQYHVRKHETFHLVSGYARVYWVVPETTFRVEAHLMRPGESFEVPPGAIHSVEAITDCVFFEVSNAVFDDRVNVEAEYAAEMAYLGACVATVAP